MLFALLSSLSLAAAAAAQVTIQVGGVYQFIPPSVNATNGTVVIFQFTGVPGNHSVTQSAFSSPCEPETGGFDSGWVFIPAGETTFPEWNLTITDDSKPLWFYCKQLLPSPHCKKEMVGAINAPAITFAAFQNAAKSFSGHSGQGVGFLVGIGASASADVGPIPSGVSIFGAPTPGSLTALASGSATASGSAGSTGTGTAAASTTPSSTNSSPSSTTIHRKPTKAIIGGAIGGLVLILLLLALFFFYRRRNNRRSQALSENTDPSPDVVNLFTVPSSNSTSNFLPINRTSNGQSLPSQSISSNYTQRGQPSDPASTSSSGGFPPSTPLRPRFSSPAFISPSSSRLPLTGSQTNLDDTRTKVPQAATEPSRQRSPSPRGADAGYLRHDGSGVRIPPAEDLVEVPLSANANERAGLSQSHSLIDSRNVVITDGQFNHILGNHTSLVININQGSTADPRSSSSNETRHNNPAQFSGQSSQVDHERNQLQVSSQSQEISFQKSNDIYERHLSWPDNFDIIDHLVEAKTNFVV